jgi:hypothetical protein
MEQWWNGHYRGGGGAETFRIATSFATNLTWSSRIGPGLLL